MNKKEEKEFKQFRVREELKIKLLKTIIDFDSVEEPSYGDLTNDDIINVLSSLIIKKTSI